MKFESSWAINVICVDPRIDSMIHATRKYSVLCGETTEQNFESLRPPSGFVVFRTIANSCPRASSWTTAHLFSLSNTEYCDKRWRIHPSVFENDILKPFRRHKNRAQATATRHRIAGNQADQRAVIDHCGNRIPRDGEAVNHRRGRVECRTSEAYFAVGGEREAGRSRVLTHAKPDKLSMPSLSRLRVPSITGAL